MEATLSNPQAFQALLKDLTAAGDGREDLEAQWKVLCETHTPRVLHALLDTALSANAACDAPRSLRLFAATQVKLGVLLWPIEEAPLTAAYHKLRNALCDPPHATKASPLAHSPQALQRTLLAAFVNMVAVQPQWYDGIIQHWVAPLLQAAKADFAVAASHRTTLALHFLLDTQHSGVTHDAAILHAVQQILQAHPPPYNGTSLPSLPCTFTLTAARLLTGAASPPFTQGNRHAAALDAILLNLLFPALKPPVTTSMDYPKNDMDWDEYLQDLLTLLHAAFQAHPSLGAAISCMESLATRLETAIADAAIRGAVGPAILDVLVQLRYPAQHLQLLRAQLHVLIMSCSDHPAATGEAGYHAWATAPIQLASLFDVFDDSGEAVIEGLAPMTPRDDADSLTQAAIWKLQELLEHTPVQADTAHVVFTTIQAAQEQLAIIPDLPPWLPVWVRCAFLALAMEHFAAEWLTTKRSQCERMLNDLMVGAAQWGKHDVMHPMMVHAHLALLSSMCLFASQTLIVSLSPPRFGALLETLARTAHEPLAKINRRTQCLALRGIDYFLRATSTANSERVTLKLQAVKQELLDSVLALLAEPPKADTTQHFIAVEVLEHLAALHVYNGDEAALQRLLLCLRDILAALSPPANHATKTLRRAVLAAIAAVIVAAADDIPRGIVHDFMKRFTATPLEEYDDDDPAIETLMTIVADIIVAMNANDFDTYLAAYLPFIMSVLIRALRVSPLTRTLMSASDAGGADQNRVTLQREGDNVVAGTKQVGAAVARVQFSYRDVYVYALSTDTLLRLVYRLRGRILPHLRTILKPLMAASQDLAPRRGDSASSPGQGYVTLTLTRLQFITAFLTAFDLRARDTWSSDTQQQFTSLLDTALLLGANLVHLPGVSCHVQATSLQCLATALHLAIECNHVLPPAATTAMQKFDALLAALQDEVAQDYLRALDSCSHHAVQAQEKLHDGNAMKALQRLLDIQCMLAAAKPQPFLPVAITIHGSLQRHTCPVLSTLATAFLAAVLHAIGTSRRFRDSVEPSVLDQWREGLASIVRDLSPALDGILAWVRKPLPQSGQLADTWWNHIATVELFAWVCVLPVPVTDLHRGSAAHTQALLFFVKLLQGLRDDDHDDGADDAGSLQSDDADSGSGNAASDPLYAAKALMLTVGVLAANLAFIPPDALVKSDWDSLFDMLPLANPLHVDEQGVFLLQRRMHESEAEEDALEEEMEAIVRTMQAAAIAGFTQAIDMKHGGLFPATSQVLPPAIAQTAARYLDDEAPEGQTDNATQHALQELKAVLQRRGLLSDTGKVLVV